MVDHVYYGRGDRGRIRLSDEQVRATIEDRRRSRGDILADLQAMADDDPISTDNRRLGHLYLLAQPETGREEALVDFLARDDVVRTLQEIIGAIVQERGNGITGFGPDIHRLSNQIPRAEGLSLTSYHPEDGLGREETLLELVIREDGGIRLTCGRGTDEDPRPRFSPSDRRSMLIYATLVLGLTHSAVALAGRLADEHAAYQGQWRLGIRMDRLRGALPADLVAGDPFHWIGNPYTRDEYEKTTSATTEELVNAPHAVTERLVAPLLRGLGIASRYLPFTATPSS